MGRVLFPTKNDIGVRTLSGVSGADYAGFRAPAEPAPRGASNPVTLGIAVSTVEFLPSRTYWGLDPIYRPPVLPAPSPAPVAPAPIVVAQPFPQPAPAPPIYRPPVLPAPSPAPVTPAPIVVAQPFPQPAPLPPVIAPPVSQQNTPTPVVTISPAPAVVPLVTSGGGTASPNAAPAAPTGSAAVAAPTGIMDSVASWLSGSTAIGTWSVPNALLAGAVILGFAFLEGGGSSTGRKR